MTKPDLNEKTLAIAMLSMLAAISFCLRFGISRETLQYVVLTGFLAWLSAEDLASRTIPNPCVLSAAGIRMAFLLAEGMSSDLGWAECGYYVLSGLGIGIVLALFGEVYERIAGLEGMGGGDVKLYAVAGLYTGAEGALLVVLLSCALACVSAVFVRPSPSDGGGFSRTLPLGPAISIALVLVLLGMPC